MKVGTYDILGECIDGILQFGGERSVRLENDLEVFGEFLDLLARRARLFFVAGHKLQYRS